MIDALLGYWANPWFALFLYWLPLSICMVGYTLRTFENYHKDVTARREYLAAKEALSRMSDDERSRKTNFLHYSPTDTIGTLIGRALVTIVPIANMWAAIFDVSPRLFCRVIEHIEAIFNQPLVPNPDR